MRSPKGNRKAVFSRVPHAHDFARNALRGNDLYANLAYAPASTRVRKAGQELSGFSDGREEGGTTLGVFPSSVVAQPAKHLNERKQLLAVRCNDDVQVIR
jgi:hypothetical protein